MEIYSLHKSKILREWITPQYLQSKTLSHLQNSFSTQKPFPFLELSRFFHPQKAAAIKKVLATETFQRKESDLFQFKQTPDFRSTSNLLLQDFRNFLSSSEFVHYLNHITNTKCRVGKIDMAGTLYEDTDFLLCHDDLLEHRAIAFFYYLSDMTLKNGGTLNLYSSGQKQPTTIAAKIQPRANTFAFFKVSANSFHSVAEVLAGPRLAISGWFHDR